MTRVRVGVRGAEPKPKRTGGSTGASGPRSSPFQVVVAASTPHASEAAYHSVRPWPAVPWVRTPGMTRRAIGSQNRAHASSRPSGPGTACRSHPIGARRPGVQCASSGPATMPHPSTATGTTCTSSNV
ncbi:hypothetical protein [Aeromicrobium sp. CnD17-E]|uniref:hypothetical protein n=1 Tax=Aeromicrobium sp. CnD17-E TaxID=2954487 RepID=UPI0020982003|nr:hypothetical protein [Aeromicrobium sp. CnD17-E]MCO7240274.1 hypothetical protein [Aeromicrobium sp. CnD17-E]